MVKLVIIIHK